MTAERRALLREAIATAVAFRWYTAYAPQRLGCGHDVAQHERFPEVTFGRLPDVRAVSMCGACWAELCATLPKPPP
jgi:hypothetical protein